MPVISPTVSSAHYHLLHCIPQKQKHQRVNYLGFSPTIAGPAITATLPTTTTRTRRVLSRWNNTNCNPYKSLDVDKCCSRALRLKASSSSSSKVVVVDDDEIEQGRNPPHISHSGAKIVDQSDGESKGEETQKRAVLDSDSDDDDDDVGPSHLMSDEERNEWRRKIRQVIDMNPDVEEEHDPIEKTKKMQKLLADYPLVVEEEDPDWPENDEDGWGFNLSQFFNKVTIKNKKKDDENYDSDKEIVWQDDDYIRAIRDITTNEWEETVFKDISPLIVLVHNRYKRPRENERARTALEKAVQIFWDSGLPSPRCVAIDAVVELDLVSALKVSVFPEILYTKAGKIIYRERVVRPAEEFSKIMAFFFYGASRPSWLKKEAGDCQEQIPTVQSNLQ